jgi:two-component system cell cycle response regulator
VSPHDARVLIVDASKRGREFAQSALSGIARLETCDAAAQALERLEQHEPIDIVVCAAPSEDEGGTRLVDRLRREHRKVDVLELTATAPTDAEPLEMDRLVLPTTPAQLRRAVEQMLLRRRLTDENRLLSGRLRTIEKCRALMPCLDPGEVYPTVLDLLLELLGRRRGMAVFRRTLPLTEALAFRGLSEEEAGRLRRSLTERKPVDPLRYEGVECIESGAVHALLADAGMAVESLLAVAVRGDSEEAGILWIFDDGSPFTRDEVEHASLVAEYAAAALRNVERYQNAKERAFIDDVTETYNVRYLLSTTENEIQRADRSGNPLSVLFLDIDRFKLVNDHHGHLVGSQTLRSLSQLLLQCVRQVDTLARYGGDEFTILLIDTPHVAAMTIAERIRRTVEEHIFEGGADQRQLKLSISIGVATFPEHAETRDSLLDAADKAMYRAKSMGRNRVCSAANL